MSEIGPTFASKLGQEHASLLGHLGCLEERPAPGTVDCAGLLVGRLREVQATLQRHFQFEEQGGYMSYILAEDAPHLYRAAQELLAEHGRLRDDLDKLITSAAGVPPESLVTAELREQVSQWVLLVRGHEGRENRLIHQACNQDIGTDD
jgi:hypothetical protein